ncbi:hypothetical protein I5M74_01855 [Serratia marcescens]|nr:hypothetical protein [Serratia marcescens]
MDKFSELSSNARKAANTFYNWSQLANCTSERVSCLTVEHLKETSELFSALLAELEAKDKRIAELGGVCSDASQVFKEIGTELGCNPDNESIMMAIDELKKDNMSLRDQRAGLVQAASELGAKLATPLRFPVVLMGYQSDDYRIGFMEGVEKSGDEVRAAGFTVEGDE